MSQRRWIEYLRDYHMTIQYDADKANVVTDALRKVGKIGCSLDCERILANEAIK